MARTYKDAANAWQLPLHSFFVFLRSNIIILLFFTICWILDREHLKKESTGSWLPAKALRAQTHIIDSPISSLSLSLIWVWRVNDYEFVLAGSCGYALISLCGPDQWKFLCYFFIIWVLVGSYKRNYNALAAQKFLHSFISLYMTDHTQRLFILQGLTGQSWYKK